MSFDLQPDLKGELIELSPLAPENWEPVLRCVGSTHLRSERSLCNAAGNLIESLKQLG
jgi:hypothetical protein